MSNKKRKTRKEKEAQIKHDFKQPIYRAPIEKAENNIEKSNLSSGSNVDPRILFDLKKVTLIIVVMIFVLLVLAYLTYKTNLFNPILTKFNIKY